MAVTGTRPQGSEAETRQSFKSVRDIAEASDNLGIAALSTPVTKWYLAWPRWSME